MINNQFKRQLLRSLGQLRDNGNLKRLIAQKRFATDRQTRGDVYFQLLYQNIYLPSFMANCAPLNTVSCNGNVLTEMVLNFL